MALLERLYQGGNIPAATKPEKVRQLRTHLQTKLGEELGKEYVWLAACTVAVEAGTWGGERRRKRREKLMRMINMCNEWLQEPIMLLTKPVDHNLYYGYSAMHKWRKDNNTNLETAVVAGWLNSRTGVI